MYDRPESGYGVFYGDGDERNVAVPLSSVDDIPGTNQRAELHALDHAVSNIADFLDEYNPDKEYVIHTDSQYVIKATTVWIKKWKSRGWTTSYGKSVANQDLIKRIFSNLNRVNKELEDNGFSAVKLEHVAGHSGDYGNEMADQLANEGADMD